ncbi:hypothetical protein QZH41_004463 [Actinostola sp. cb2023]|nr:hypothetical protein QZH41_004463 [Actinostola sp. cb2023]
MANISGIPHQLNNSAAIPPPRFPRILNVLIVYSAVAVLVLSIASNLLALAVCTHIYKRSPSVMLGYLASLSVANLCFSFLACVDFSVHFDASGELACKMEGFLTETSYISAILILVCISYERMTVVATPILARLKRFRFRKWLPVSVWVVSLVLCSPLLFFYTRRHGHCTSILLGSFPRLLFYVLQTVFLFILSLLFMLWAHIKIFKTLARHSVFRKGSSSAAKIFRSDAKLTKMLVAVMVIFFVCHTPFMAMLLMLNLGMAKGTLLWQTAFRVSQLVMFTQTCINPFIYCFFSKQFRQSCKEVLTCRCGDSRVSSNRYRGTSGTTSIELQAVSSFAGRGVVHEKEVTVL